MSRIQMHSPKGKGVARGRRDQDVVWICVSILLKYVLLREWVAVVANPDEQCQCLWNTTESSSSPMLLKNSPRCTDCNHFYHGCGDCKIEYVQEQGGRRTKGETQQFAKSYTPKHAHQAIRLSAFQAPSTTEPHFNPACIPLSSHFTPVDQQSGILNFGPQSSSLPEFEYVNPESLSKPQSRIAPQSLDNFDWSTEDLGVSETFGLDPSYNAPVGFSKFGPQHDDVVDTSTTPCNTLYYHGFNESNSYLSEPDRAGPYKTPCSEVLAPRHIAALHQSRDQGSIGFVPKDTRASGIASPQSTAEPSSHRSVATRRMLSRAPTPPKGAKRRKQGKPPAKASSGNTSPETRPFACPFVWYNPKEHRGCLRNTLMRIRDVKQHLKRAHGQPDFCTGCGDVFRNDVERKNHSNCQLRMTAGPGSITEEQASSLGHKPKREAYNDHKAQWYIIWDTIFPHLAQERPLSPYQPDDFTLLTIWIRKNGMKTLMSNPRFGHLAPNFDETISAVLALIHAGSREMLPESPALPTHVSPPQSVHTFGLSQTDIPGVDEDEFSRVSHDLGWDLGW